MPLSRSNQIKQVRKSDLGKIDNGYKTDYNEPNEDPKLLRRVKSAVHLKQKPKACSKPRYAWGEIYPSDDILAPIRRKESGQNGKKSATETGKETVLKTSIPRLKRRPKDEKNKKQISTKFEDLSKTYIHPFIESDSQFSERHLTISTSLRSSSDLNDRYNDAHFKGARPKSWRSGINRQKDDPYSFKQVVISHNRSQKINTTIKSPIQSTSSPSRSSTTAKSHKYKSTNRVSSDSSPVSDRKSGIEDAKSDDLSYKYRRSHYRTVKTTKSENDVSDSCSINSGASISRKKGMIYSDTDTFDSLSFSSDRSRLRLRSKANSETDTFDTESITSRGSSSYSDIVTSQKRSDYQYYVPNVSSANQAILTKRNVRALNTQHSNYSKTLESNKTKSQNSVSDKEDSSRHNDEKQVQKIEVNLTHLGTIQEEYHIDEDVEESEEEHPFAVANNLDNEINSETDFEEGSPHSQFPSQDVNVADAETCPDKSPAAFLFENRTYKAPRPKLSFLSLVLKVKTSEEDAPNESGKQNLSRSLDLPKSNHWDIANDTDNRQRVKTVKKPSKLQKHDDPKYDLQGSVANNIQPTKRVTLLRRRKKIMKNSDSKEQDRKLSARRLSAGTLLTRVQHQYDDIPDGYSATLNKDKVLPVFNYLRYVKEFPEIYENLMGASPSTDSLAKPLLSYGQVYQSSQLLQTNRTENNVVQAAYNLGDLQLPPAIQQNHQQQSSPISKQVNALAMLKRPPHLRNYSDIRKFTETQSSEHLKEIQEKRKRQKEEQFFMMKKSASERLNDLKHLQVEAETCIRTLSTADAIRAREMSLRALGEEDNSIRKWWLAQKFCKYLRENKMEDRVK